ncbi:hypothetical protein [Anaerocolumna chitinilytica]|uniref:Uncharacterized protein n=1 Tax=Anaerocolumna chitinilytica TaxID=1727145 RepID=A0A7M3S9Y0_9FIRM|nr:hypothetical protein [Anaerocolumna chitinilytica]BCK01398.1 hypothetical protein bsdcttw_44380 [Anaerocolumna chitinilytica]
MKTLVIYDTTGRIIYQGSGDVLEPVGIPFLWLEIPTGKILKSIDTSKPIHTPLYEDVPKTEIDDVKEQLAAVQIALAEMMGV